MKYWLILSMLLLTLPSYAGSVSTRMTDITIRKYHSVDQGGKIHFIIKAEHQIKRYMTGSNLLRQLQNQNRYQQGQLIINDLSIHFIKAYWSKGILTLNQVSFVKDNTQYHANQLHFSPRMNTLSSPTIWKFNQQKTSKHLNYRLTL